MELDLLEAIPRYTTSKKVTGNSQHRFTKAIACLTNLIAFYDEMISSINKGEQQILFTLTFGKLLTKFPIGS